MKNNLHFMALRIPNSVPIHGIHPEAFASVCDYKDFTKSIGNIDLLSNRLSNVCLRAKFFSLLVLDNSLNFSMIHHQTVRLFTT